MWVLVRMYVLWFLFRADLYLWTTLWKWVRMYQDLDHPLVYTYKTGDLCNSQTSDKGRLENYDQWYRMPRCIVLCKASIFPSRTNLKTYLSFFLHQLYHPEALISLLTLQLRCRIRWKRERNISSRSWCFDRPSNSGGPKRSTQMLVPSSRSRTRELWGFVSVFDFAFQREHCRKSFPFDLECAFRGLS